MSSLRKVGKKWTIEFYYRGRYFHRSLKVTSRADALDLQRRIDYLIASNRFNPHRFWQQVNDRIPTLHEFLDEVQEHLEHLAGRYTRRTMETYRFYLRRARALLPDIPLDEMTKRFIEADVIPRIEETRSYEGLRSFLIHLRRFFAFAVEWGYLERNPFSGIVPRRRKRLPRCFSDEEIRRMLDYLITRPAWQLDMVVLALSTGLRLNELFQLRWDNVQNNQIRIVGKGDKERLIPLNMAAQAVMLRRPRHHERVFPEITSPFAIKSMWRRLRHATGIDGRFHDLRSTWASRNLMAGIPLAQLKAWGGWDSFEMISVYGTFTLEAMGKRKPVEIDSQVR